MLLPLKLTRYQSQIDILTLWFSYPIIFSKPSLSRACLPLLSPPEILVRHVPPTAAIVEAHSSFIGNLKVRNLCTSHHAPDRASAFQQAFIACCLC